MYRTLITRLFHCRLPLSHGAHVQLCLPECRCRTTRILLTPRKPIVDSTVSGTPRYPMVRDPIRGAIGLSTGPFIFPARGSSCFVAAGPTARLAPLGQQKVVIVTGMLISACAEVHYHLAHAGKGFSANTIAEHAYQGLKNKVNLCFQLWHVRRDRRSF